MKRYLLVLLLSFFYLSCNNDESNPVVPETGSNQEIYRLAVIDAMYAEETEICSTLIVIKPENTYLSWNNGYVLVVTWTKYSSSYPEGDTISTWWGETWVTAVPEIRDWFTKNTVSKENLVLRTEQLLGMPENTGNKYFAELWVKPEDLLRPSYDNEITDNICGLYFPENAETEYIRWFNDNILSSYYSQSGENKYPWTRLGYTYDWGNVNNEVGLSEFIIKKDSKVIVKSLQSTEEYFN